MQRIDGSEGHAKHKMDGDKKNRNPAKKGVEKIIKKSVMMVLG